MNALSPLEWDLITDMAEDTHGVWELFGFARLHHPGATDEEIFHVGRSTLASWLERGWLELATDPLYPSNVVSLSQVLPQLDSLGLGGTRYFPEAPSFNLSAQARVDLALLRKAEPT